MKNILVTGSSGYIGSGVAKRLLERGYDVSVFDNLERGHRYNVDPAAKLIVGDLRNEGEIWEAMSKVCPEAGRLRRRMSSPGRLSAVIRRSLSRR